MDFNKIKQARKDAGLTQRQAADLVYSSLRTWQNWERNGNIHPAIFELFMMKVKK
jgi:DNA-binding XRE family transcriptional regulator